MMPSNYGFTSSNCSMPQEYVQSLGNVELTVRLGTRVWLAGNGLILVSLLLYEVSGFFSVLSSTEYLDFLLGNIGL